MENEIIEKHYFRFDGEGLDLFKIYLSNLLLTIITFGVYYFWAKVRVKKYMYRHTQFFGNRFDYHATGKERFIGFLKGLLFLSVVIAIVGLIGYLLYLKFKNVQILTTFIPLVFYFLLFLLAPLIMVGRERFRLSRSSWSNVRFRYDGKIKDAYLLFIKGGLLSAITCGIYYAWFYIDIKKFIIENSKIGNQSFKFKCDPGQLIYIFFLGYFSIIGVIVGFAITAGIITAIFKNALLLIPFAIIFFIAFLFVASWWNAMLTRFFWAATSFQDISFESHLNALKVFKVILLTIVLVVFTLGIGFPWAIVINSKLILENLSLNGKPEINTIIASKDRDASAVYDGISEAGTVIDSISDIFGM